MGLSRKAGLQLLSLAVLFCAAGTTARGVMAQSAFTASRQLERLATQDGPTFWTARLVNDGSATASSVEVSLAVEPQTPASAATFSFEYQVGTPDGGFTEGEWTSVTGLDFSLLGSDATSEGVLSRQATLRVDIAPGREFRLRYRAEGETATQGFTGEVTVTGVESALATITGLAPRPFVAGPSANSDPGPASDALALKRSAESARPSSSSSAAPAPTTVPALLSTLVSAVPRDSLGPSKVRGPNQVAGPELPPINSLGVYPSGTDVNFEAYIDDTPAGQAVTDRGFVYSPTNTTPTIGGADVTPLGEGGTGSGWFYGGLSDLPHGTFLYVQAYATNPDGTAYAGPQHFRACNPIEVTRPSSAFLNTSYSSTLSASGGSGPYTFSIGGGSLPDGLELNDGVIEGTATEIGRPWVELVATDSTGCTGVIDFCFSVGTPIVQGSVLISEFRLRGPFGTQDEYVELANTTDEEIVVSASDNSDGWSIGGDGLLIATIPNGTVIPPRGHWLATGWNFSLWDYPAGAGEGLVWEGDRVFDDGCEADVPEDSGIALFSTASVSDYDTDNRLDAVGSTSEENPLFYEGDPENPTETLLPELGDTEGANFAWVRRTSNNGDLLDAGNNARDFALVSTGAENLSGVSALLGGPSPESTISPVDAGDETLVAYLPEPLRSANQEPNRFVADWTIQYRMRFVNTGSDDLSVLRFKVINLTTQNSPHSFQTRQAALRLSSVDDDAEFFANGGGHYLVGARLDDEQIYPQRDYDYYAGKGEGSDRPVGGLNSTLSVDLGECFSPQQEQLQKRTPQLGPTGEVYVNLQALVLSNGYYTFLVVPQATSYCPFEGPPKTGLGAATMHTRADGPPHGGGQKRKGRGGRGR